MKMFLVLAAVAVSSSLVLPTVAHADSLVDTEQLSATVRYNSSDLSTAEGVARLEKRVASKIRRMCSDHAQLRLASHRVAAKCIEEARVKAKRDVELAVQASKSKASRRA